MKMRRTEDDLGLDPEAMRRIQAAAAAAVVPGLEGLARESVAGGSRDQAPDPPATGPIRSTDPLPGKKHARGRRMI